MKVLNHDDAVLGHDAKVKMTPFAIVHHLDLPEYIKLDLVAETRQPYHLGMPCHVLHV